MKEGYERLANEIILTGVKDYRTSLWALKKNPRNKSAAHLKKEVEEFFNSEWFGQLTDADPKMIIEKLKAEIS